MADVVSRLAAAASAKPLADSMSYFIAGLPQFSTDTGCECAPLDRAIHLDCTNAVEDESYGVTIAGRFPQYFGSVSKYYRHEMWLKNYESHQSDRNTQ